MPIEVTVGPPALVINQGSTFVVTDLDGQIRTGTDEGVFAQDTRFLSYYEVSANGEPWKRLTSSVITYYSARIFLTNPEFTTEQGVVAEGDLSLVISRSVAEGVHEDLDVTNYGSSSVSFNLEIALRSDFADIFEVKSRNFVRRGRVVTQWDAQNRELRTSYSNGDFRRSFIYRLGQSDSVPVYANGRLSFEVALEPGGKWRACCLYLLRHDQHERAPRRSSQDRGEVHFDTLQREWEQSTTRLTSGNEEVYRLYRQSVEDIGALRLHEHDMERHVWLPAAGVPWFVTIFGRDSIIVSLQCMIVCPLLALGTLQKLAQLQATELDPWRDAEPGKMPHELRFGELAYFKRIPHTPYYGTADATPLYLVLLHETWKWLGDDALLRQYRDTAERCLSWIDDYGDIDGDGFQEYKTRSSQGYPNMSWKDAEDAIVYPDGSQVLQPKGLCEMQGYVFDAWMRMAEVFEALGEPERSAELRRKAARLQAKFEEAFWLEDARFYALGLDPQKQPIATIASNPGHCLWSGIVRADRARRVAERMTQPDMWSGWGIRTLSSQNPAYNPFSYQRGSVWPHDNGIIAMGFKRYGMAEEAARVARDVSEAAEYFQSHRLPELYAGIERTPGSFPVQYAGANVPQAWAAGSTFFFLRAILGLQADASAGRLYVDPVLPHWLPDVTLSGLQVGSATVDIRFWRDGDETRWDVLKCQGDLHVEQRAWEPWRPEAAR